MFCFLRTRELSRSVFVEICVVCVFEDSPAKYTVTFVQALIEAGRGAARVLIIGQKGALQHIIIIASYFYFSVLLNEIDEKNFMFNLLIK